MDSDGKLTYFQPYIGNEDENVAFVERAYVIIIDDTRIEGKPITTSNIRQVLGSDRYNDNEKKKFFHFICGWFDEALYILLTSKFKSAYRSVSPEEPVNRVNRIRLPSTPKVNQPQINNTTKSRIHQMVREVLGEIMDEDYGGMTTSNSSGMNAGGISDTTIDTKTPAQQKSDYAKQKQSLVKQKQALELQAKQDKQQRDQYATTVKNYDQVKKKADRDAIDTVNKQLSQPSTISTTSTTSAL